MLLTEVFWLNIIALALPIRPTKELSSHITLQQEDVMIRAVLLTPIRTEFQKFTHERDIALMETLWRVGANGQDIVNQDLNNLKDVNIFDYM